MNNLKILVVEGNTSEENINFNVAGCVPQSENFKQHVKKIEPNCEIDLVSPGDEQVISRIFSSLKKYNGIILTGSTLRVNDNSEEIKKHIQFAKTYMNAFSISPHNDVNELFEVGIGAIWPGSSPALPTG